MRTSMTRVAFAVAACCVALAQPAHGGGEGGDGTYVVGSDPTDGKVYAGVQVNSGGWRGAPNRCTYQTWSAALLTIGIQHPGTSWTDARGVTYVPHLKTCPGDGWLPRFEDRLRGTMIDIPIIPPGPTMPYIAFGYVERLAPNPTFVSAPADGKTWVKLGTWFWTTTPFESISATSAIPSGRGWMWATVTATPISLTYDPGDGHYGAGPKTCSGPGEVWHKSYGDERTTACEYTFTHSSRMAADKEQFHGSVQITWKVTYELSNRQRGDLAGFTTSTPVDMHVGEIQAVIVA